MYTKLSGDAASSINFPDCVIESFHADINTISFRSDGIFIAGEGFIEAPVDVRIDFGAVRSRDYADGVFCESDPSSATGLCDIGEWKVESGLLMFAGFALHGHAWREFVLADFSVTIVSAP